MIIHYLKVAFRNLWKYKVQNLIGIVGLSVGFVCFSLLMHISRYQMEYDTQYPEYERMYRLHTVIPKLVLINNFPEFEKIISGYGNFRNSVKLEIDENNEIPLQITSFTCNPDILDFFSFTIIAGDTATINRTPNSYVLFESEAKKLVDNPESLIGKTINPGYQQLYTITGIVKDMPSNSSFSNGYTGFHFNEPANVFAMFDKRSSYFVFISKGVSIDDVKSKLAALEKEYFQEEDTEATGFFKVSQTSSISVINSKSQMPEIKRTIWFCFIIGLLILMTVLFNYISFLLSQFYNRFKEGAIRIAEGAGFKDIFYLFYAEMALGFLISVALSFFILSFSSTAVDDYFFREITISYFSKSELILPALRLQMLEYTAWCLVLGAIVCLMPAKIIYNKGVRAAMNVTPKGKKAVGRAVILLFQLIVLSAVIITTATMNRQIRNMRTSYLPTLNIEEQRNIISVRCNMQELWNLEETLSQNMTSSQSIRDVTFSSDYITHGNWGFTSIPDFPEERIGTNRVAPDFLQFFNAKLLHGNFLNNESDIDDVIVNQKFTELLGEEYAIGKTFRDGTITQSGDDIQYGKQKRIVGVIEGIPHIGEIGGKLTDVGRDYPFYYQLSKTSYDYVIYVKAVPSRYAEARQHVEKCIREFVPDTYELEFSTVYDDLGKSFNNEQLIRSITLIFSVLALILGLLSIFSSVMMNTEKRKKEIAIRKVNGALVKEIIILFSKTYMLLWSLACIIVFPVAYFYLNRWLESYSEHISLPVILFFVVFILIAALIMITVIFRIIKIARENPADVLKTE